MIYMEPNAGIAPIVEMVEQAKPNHELMLNFYYLDNQDALQAISQASARGVHVFAIVEGHPYGIDPGKVQVEISSLQEAGAKVETTPKRFQGSAGRYAFDHAKYMVTQGEVLIATANLDEAAVTRNREYIYTSNDSTLVKAMETLFVADWSGGNDDAQVKAMAPNLVLSPGAVDPIVQQINQPGPICAEVEELGTDRDILTAFAAKGANATLIVPSGGGYRERKTLDTLAYQFGVKVYEMPAHQIYLHAKMIAGDASAYLGSQNFSETSLEHNREVGIVLTNPGEVSRLGFDCADDVERSRPLSRKTY